MDAEMPRRGGTATPSDALHPQEKRELKRVFVMLCDYHAKQKCVGPYTMFSICDVQHLNSNSQHFKIFTLIRLRSDILARKEQLSELQLPLDEKKNTGMHDFHCSFSFLIFHCAGE